MRSTSSVAAIFCQLAIPTLASDLFSYKSTYMWTPYDESLVRPALGLSISNDYTMRINVSTDAANPAYLLGLKPEDKATIVSREWYIQSTIRYHGNITEFRFDEWEIKSSLSITSGIRATVALIAGWDYEVSANETGPALIAEFSNPTNGTQPIQVQRKATDIGHRLPSCGGHDPGKMYFMPAGLKLHFNLTLERTGDGQNNGEGVIGFKDNNALSLSTKLQRVEGCARADCSTDRTGFKRCYSQYSE